MVEAKHEIGEERVKQEYMGEEEKMVKAKIVLGDQEHGKGL